MDWNFPSEIFYLYSFILIKFNLACFKTHQCNCFPVTMYRYISTTENYVTQHLIWFLFGILNIADLQIISIPLFTIEKINVVCSYGDSCGETVNMEQLTPVTRKLIMHHSVLSFVFVSCFYQWKLKEKCQAFFMGLTIFTFIMTVWKTGLYKLLM